MHVLAHTSGTHCVDQSVTYCRYSVCRYAATYLGTSINCTYLAKGRRTVIIHTDVLPCRTTVISAPMTTNEVLTFLFIPRSSR